MIPDFLAHLAAQEDLRPHLERFAAHSQEYIQLAPDQAKHQTLKRDHTWRVLNYASQLVSGAKLSSPAVDRAALLAALYHDIGRFEQFRIYGTYADAVSANHATLSLLAMHKIRALEGETKATTSLIKAAVALHNRFALPANTTGDRFMVAHLLRDADKLDIVQVMAGQLGPGCTPDPVVVMYLQNEPGKCTRSNLEIMARGERIHYNDLRYVNDFRLLISQWADALHYPQAKRIMVQEGHLHRVVLGIDAPEAASQVQNFLKKHEQ